MQSTQQPQRNAPPGGLFKDTGNFLLITALVGLLVATLFTAWTEPGLVPGSFSRTYDQSLSLQATETSQSQPTATARSRPLVGIVVGHWDDATGDPGAVCSDVSLTEFQVNQTIATLVRDLLLEQGIDVDMLREFDPLLSGYRATVLISIHADSCDYINDQATGFKVSAALANPAPERSARLTACMRNRYGESTGLSLHNSITPDMTSYHAFDEINPETTAAIIEVGFLNLDRQLLTQEPQKSAQGIVNGILCYLNNENLTPAVILPTTTPTSVP